MNFVENLSVVLLKLDVICGLEKFEGENFCEILLLIHLLAFLNEKRPVFVRILPASSSKLTSMCLWE